MEFPGRPFPTTFEFIESIAVQEPRRLALVQDNQGWSYADVHLDLVRVIRVLQELGVKRDDCVAVGASGFQAGLLVLLAAENLGAITISFLHEKDADAQAVFGRAQWVFSDCAQDVKPPARFVALDADFIARLQSVDVSQAGGVPRVPREVNDVQRITRTSGSSGSSKFMALTRLVQEYWIGGVARGGAILPDSRVLVAGPLVLNGHFTRVSACLRMGAAALDLSRTGLAGHEITHVCALPAVLEQIVGSLPPGYKPSRPVQVNTAGGFVTPDLRARVARAFGGPVINRYGLNEAGSVCEDLDANGVGVISPGTDVRILDLEGKEVPFGELGVITVRTPAMADGYLDNPEASHATFRDGWFHTGDWGAVVGHRLLRLAGRHDDLVNAGGVKIPAAHVEAQVRALVNPSDCAVLAVNLDAGGTALGIAVVIDAGVSRDDVRRALGGGLKLGATVGARILFLPELPRTGNAKVDRHALHRLFESPPPGST